MPLQFRDHVLLAARGVGVRGLALVDHALLLFQAAAQFRAQVGLGQARVDQLFVRFQLLAFIARGLDHAADGGMRDQQAQVQPDQLFQAVGMRGHHWRTVEHGDDFPRARFEFLLASLQHQRQLLQQVAVTAIDRILLQGIGVYGGAETAVVGEPVQVQGFGAGAEQEEAGAEEKAGQGERGDAEPVGRNRHAQGPRVECRGEVGRALAHAGSTLPASGRSEAGTKRRSVASAIAMRIWNSSTSSATGAW